MTKKIKTLIIVLGFLVLLAGAYIGSTVWVRTKEEAAFASYTSAMSAYTPPDRLGNLERENIVKIEVPELTLEKRNNVWELISLNGETPPDGIELDQFQIDSLTWSLASVWYDNIVEEEPEDISIYGLDNPSIRASVTDSGGKRVEYLVGDIHPSRSFYYFMEAGNPKVYTVSIYSAENFSFSVDRIKLRPQLPDFDFSTLAYMRLEMPQRQIEIQLKPEELPYYLSTSFSPYMISSPYRLPRGADIEAINKVAEQIFYLQLMEVIDSNPSSLRQYGLDQPSRIFVQSEDDSAENSMEILIGNRIDGYYYAKMGDSPRVFTLSGVESIFSTRPFSLVDKFALILNIDSVERLTVTGGVRPLTAEFHGQRDEAVFFLNGRQAEDRSFRLWYQAVIGLLIDAEIPDRNWIPQNNGEGNITIEYELNIAPGARASITLIPYNRDFYALSQEGTMEFLIARTQVNRIWDTADRVVYE